MVGKPPGKRVITANWETPGTKWSVPIGAGFGRIVKVGGKLPVKLQIGGFYNVVTPQFGARWQLQSTVAVIF